MKKIENGIIVSVQGMGITTTNEIVGEAIKAGAVAIRTDKILDKINVPIIGLKKLKVKNLKEQAYITPDIDSIEQVKEWADYIAIDFRRCNYDLDRINKYCIKNNINIVADIGTIEDYQNIIAKKYKVNYITTALSVYYHKKYFPDLTILEKLNALDCKNIIAEGEYKTRADVVKAFELCNNVCIGNAICNIYRLTEKFVSCTPEWKKNNFSNRGI
jgi:putative N-acetylmannosamine-6-phosphate epimerase